MRWLKLFPIFGLLVVLLIVGTIAITNNPKEGTHRLLVAQDLSPYGEVDTAIPESPFEKGKATGPGALAGWEEARSTTIMVGSGKPGENAALVTSRSYKFLTSEAAQAALRAVQDPGLAFSWVTSPEDASLPDQTQRQALAGRSSGWRAWHGTDNERLPAYALWIQFGSYISEVQLTVGIGQELFGRALFNQIIDRLVTDPAKR